MYVKKTNNANYSKRYTDQFRADAVRAYRALREQNTVNAEQIVADEFGCSRASVTAWHRADRAANQGNTRKKSRPAHPHTAAAVAEAQAREEAAVLADVMAEEAVTPHTSGGIHPTLTAYEDAAERYDHQRSVVDTLHAELSVHTERLAELERAMNDSKKALQELVNSL